MSGRAIYLPNPFRPSSRVTFEFPDGATVAEVALIAGVPNFAAMIDHELVEAEHVIGRNKQVTLYRVPEGITLVGLGKFLLSVVASAVINIGLNLLFPPPKPQQARDSAESPTYAFSGVTNNRQEGQPIPVGYGELKLGGTIINEYIESGGVDDDDVYRALIAFGEGPFTSVGGVTVDTPQNAPLEGQEIPVQVQINGNAAANFAGVKAWARLGTNQQETVPGFDETRTTNPIGVELPFEVGTNSTATQNVITGWDSGPGAQNTTVNDPLWEEYGYSYDITTEVDAAVIRFEFPQGFFRVDSDGDTQNARFGYQVRYRELDGSNNPITTGGPLLDGYFRAFPRDLTFRRRSPFSISERVDFVDIQGTEFANPGNAYILDGTPGTQITFDNGPDHPFAQGQEVTDFSASVWCKFDTIPSGAEHVIFSTYQTGGNASGFQLIVNSGGRLQLRYQRSSGINNFSAPAGSLGDLGTSMDAWKLFGLTLSNDAVELYVNGRLIFSFTEPDRGRFLWSQADLQIGSEDLVGKIDQTFAYRVPVTAQGHEFLYNGGIGRSGGGSDEFGLSDDIVLQITYSSGFGRQSYTTGSRNWWGSTPFPTIGGGATTGAGGIVTDVGSGSPNRKRSRYRLEIIRWRRKSTSARTNNDAEVQSIQTVISEQFTYPGAALLGVEVRATDQLQGGTPTVTAICKQRPAKIWDGVSTSAPNIRDEYSTNPAWVALAHTLSPEIGLGTFYRPLDVVLPTLLDWANYCDQITYDGTRKLLVDNTNLVGAEEFDVEFDDTTADPASGEERHQITFVVPFADINVLPGTYEAGRFIRVSGLPTDANPNVDVDPNSPTNEGYEIQRVDLVLGSWRIVCWWDREDEGDPWPGASLVTALGGDPTDIDGALIEGGSRRFEFNGIFDQPGRAWEALLDICATGRATPVPIGSGIKFRFSAPREHIGLLSPGNIVEGSFKVNYAAPRTRANVITLNILDRERNFEPVPITSQSADLESVANQTFIRQENRTLFGVTDAGQAERQGNHIIAVNELQVRSGEFRAGLDSWAYEPGDVLRVTSEVLVRGSGARIAGNSGSNNLAMTSDREDFSGAAWTVSGVTVTDNVETDPVRGTATADRINGDGSVTQTLAPNRYVEGWHTASIFFKDDSGSAPSMELITDRLTAGVTFDLSALTANAGSSFDMPTRGGIQDVGGGWRYCWATWYVNPSDGNKLPTSLALRIRPIRGGFSASVFAAQVCVTQSEFPAMAPGLRNLVLSEAFTVPSGPPTISYMDVRRDVNDMTIDTTLTPAGDYVAGSTVFVTADLPLQAVRGNPVVISGTDELLIELKNARRSSDLSASFDWVEFNEGVFDDDAVEDDSFRNGDIESEGGGPQTGTGIFDLTPNPPRSAVVRVFSTEDSTGNQNSNLSVGWTHDESTIHLVTGTDVFGRVVPEGDQGLDAESGWSLVAHVDGRVSQVELPLVGVEVGSTYEVSVCSLSRSRPRGTVGNGFSAQVLVDPLSWSPEAPTEFSIDASGSTATYGFEYDSAVEDDGRRPSKRIEIRRGGWVLGQVVAVTDEGTLFTEATEDVYVPAGDAEVGRLYARARSRDGTYSGDVQLAPSPTLAFSAEMPDIAYGPDIEWETQTAGTWATGFPPADGPVLGSNFQINSDNEIEFGVSGLAGFFTAARDDTAVTTVSQSRPPRRLYVGAACEATQVHPITAADLPYATGSLELQRWTAEGPTLPSFQDGTNATVEIQFRVNSDGTSSGWGPWRPFRCGFYELVDVQFRLRMTRPTTDYNIRVKRFHTTLRVPLRTFDQHSTGDFSARSEFL